MQEWMLGSSTVLSTVKYFIIFSSHQWGRLGTKWRRQPDLFSNQADSWRCLAKIPCEYFTVWRSWWSRQLLYWSWWVQSPEHLQFFSLASRSSLITSAFNHIPFHVPLLKEKNTHMNYSDWLRTLADRILFLSISGPACPSHDDEWNQGLGWAGKLWSRDSSTEASVW